MSDALKSVEQAALALSAEERAALIDLLIPTVASAPQLHAEWEAEISRRVAEMDAGLVESILGEQVFAELRVMIESHEARS